MSDDMFDIAVVGAGPAGATAANLLAGKQQRVVLVDGETFPRKEASYGWLNTRAVSMLQGLGPKVERHLKQGFSDVSFHDADFSKTAKPKFEGTAGYLIDRVAFTNDLVAAAVKAGATAKFGATVSDIKLLENSVRLILAGGETVESRLLVLASGRDGVLLDRGGFTREGGASAMWTAQVDGDLKKPVGGKPRVIVVLGADKLGSFGICCLMGRHVSVSINWLGEKSDAISALITLCRLAYEHQVLPADFSAQAAGAALVRSPASLALDMDTHVGKHSLVIGDAGGFVSAASNEGIYPGMWSAQIASEVLLTALKGRQSQDDLMAFDAAWRMQMADYLRSPNTDHQFLLPLIFSNQPMADRMGAAIFFGENI